MDQYLQKTKTYENLKNAFSAEAEAKAKYEYYLSIAQKEKLPKLVSLLKELVDNENEHCEVWAKELDLIGLSAHNILDAIKIENYEETTMYREYAKQAEEDGYPRLAYLFNHIGDIEEKHETYLKDIYRELYSNTKLDESNTVEIWFWKCTKCGNFYYIEDQSQPEKYLQEVCTVCGHDRSYFKIVKMKIVSD